MNGQNYNVAQNSAGQASQQLPPPPAQQNQQQPQQQQLDTKVQYQQQQLPPNVTANNNFQPQPSNLPQQIDQNVNQSAQQQQQQQQAPKHQPLLAPETNNDHNVTQSGNQMTNQPPAAAISVANNPVPSDQAAAQQQPPPQLPGAQGDPQQQQSSGSPQRAAVTKVKLSEELNIFDWFRTTDIINQIAEKARSSVDTVITTLDPGMKEYLYSGGNVNIVVISDHDSMVSPIRDAFQSVFGRATVQVAKFHPPESASAYPVKLACGFDEAIIVAQERIKKFRQDMNKVPQNQVVVVVQPAVVSVTNDETVNNRVRNGLKLDDSLLPRWFLTYCILIEDPVLGATMNCYSQLVPIDLDVVAAAREAPFPQGYKDDDQLGFARSIDDIMESKLKLVPPHGAETNGRNNDDEDRVNKWLPMWAGLDETKTIHELSLSLAHLYRRKWNDCLG